MRAQRSSCARQISLDWIGLCNAYCKQLSPITQPPVQAYSYIHTTQTDTRRRHRPRPILHQHSVVRQKYIEFKFGRHIQQKSSSKSSVKPNNAQRAVYSHPSRREWTRPFRVLLPAQCQLQMSPITQPRVRHIHNAVPHSATQRLTYSLQRCCNA